MATWKTIEEFPNYEASTDGEIRNKKTKKLKAQFNNGSNYYQVGLSKDGKHYLRLVHRIIAQTFIPNPNNLDTVDHIYPDTSINNVKNLQWMSREDNIVKAVSKKIWLSTDKVQWTEFISIREAAKYIAEHVNGYTPEGIRGRIYYKENKGSDELFPNVYFRRG